MKNGRTQDPPSTAAAISTRKVTTVNTMRRSPSYKRARSERTGWVVRSGVVNLYDSAYFEFSVCEASDAVRFYMTSRYQADIGMPDVRDRMVDEIRAYRNDTRPVYLIHATLNGEVATRVIPGRIASKLSGPILDCPMPLNEALGCSARTETL